MSKSLLVVVGGIMHQTDFSNLYSNIEYQTVVGNAIELAGNTQLIQ